MALYHLFSMTPGRLEYEKGKKPILYNPKMDLGKGERYFAEVEQITLQIRKLQRRRMLAIAPAPEEDIFAVPGKKPLKKKVEKKAAALAKAEEPKDTFDEVLDDAFDGNETVVKSDDEGVDEDGIKTADEGVDGTPDLPADPDDAGNIPDGEAAGSDAVPSGYQEKAAIGEASHDQEDEFGVTAEVPIDDGAMERIRELMADETSLASLKLTQKDNGSGKFRSRNTIVAGIVAKERGIKGLVIRPTPLDPAPKL